MPWAKFDDQFFAHPKLALLEEYRLPCVGLHVLAVCYCNAYLTDGVVKRQQLPLLAGEPIYVIPYIKSQPHEGGEANGLDDFVKKLLDVGLWERTKPFDETKDESLYTGNYRIHDYLNYNPSREEVLQLRETRTKVGVVGGKASGEARRKQVASRLLRTRRSKIEPRPGPSRPIRKDLLLRKDLPPPIIPPKGEARMNGFRREAGEILDFLNRKAAKHFPADDTNLGLILGRLKDGATVSQCRAIVGIKCNEWRNDPERRRYLRPATLFNKLKFSQYLGELPATAFQPELPELPEPGDEDSPT